LARQRPEERTIEEALGVIDDGVPDEEGELVTKGSFEPDDFRVAGRSGPCPPRVPMISRVAPTGARDSTHVGAGVRRSRWWHLATFVAAVFGVGLQLWIEFDPAPNPDRPEFSTPIRLWNVLSYFTVWSNILVLVVAYLLWRDQARRGTVFAVFRLASLVMITVTGVIYALVLAPLWNPTGWQRVADETLHYTVPILAVVSFLVVGPRPRFAFRTLWAALLIPLVYIAYTLLRSPFITYTQDGQTRHWYPYHFLNVDDLGYGRVLLNIAAIFLLLLAIAGVYFFLDRKLPERPTRPAAT
jgi:hypothetical protein